ncbi:nitrate/nitrite transport system substrate-binding protein [Pseudomonas flavescens]|uniref:Nitrate/nitrite transport system substrate-binding protein n=1 Tax=Phytopseudomonas flavescens TaxID=29435 RepID=A0A1G8KQQ7_9GAMM|nr:CmpA/NrtA family ABC transporter substrate-binding protein [Pseudomonas flavescens]SDI45729.1 nitrate/nitrite transport system substrate-binding protein [Pseudomonas flavescens]
MDDKPRTAPTVDDSADQARRTFLKRSTGLLASGALMNLLPAGLSSAVWAADSDGLETTRARLGFIALSDAAPLFVADELGLFAKHGMTDVEVLKQSSWGTTRDNLMLGAGSGGIDGAHILTPMPYLMAAGKITSNNAPLPMVLLARLNLNGQGISISNEYQDLKLGSDASAFKQALAAKRAKGQKIAAAMTFPGGTHDLWLRYWMAAGGIEPNKDLPTVVIPPPQMVANMKVGSMDAFCVGEPWNAQLINQGIGYSAVTSGELWANHPEKALSLRADYVDANPNATRALLKAVMEAQMFCEAAENKERVAEICAKRRWIGAPAKDLLARLQGNIAYGNGRVVENSPHRMRFWSEFASYPFQSHDLWFLTENKRWGYLPEDFDSQALIATVNREGIWRQAAAELGVPAEQIPQGKSRGVETFFDGKTFDPQNPQAYLDSLSLKGLTGATP